jgi:hypothetical protein
MRPQTYTILAAVLVCAGGAAAWQSALSAVGWTEQRASEIAESFFTNSSYALPDSGSMSPAIKQKWLGRSPTERAQAIRDLALHAKGYVQAPAFQKLYDGWIKDHYRAVNHGIKLDRNAPASAEYGNAAMSAAASEMAKAFGELPADALRMILTTDIDGLKNSTKDPDKQMLARYRRVESLLKTNLPEARKQYALAKSMQMLGQTDESQVQAKLADGLKAGADLKRMEEQRAYDEHNLKTALRRRLTGFIALAESVDFAATTQRQAGRMVFTDRALEGKPHHWKLLYRLGKEPTLAAVAVAKQWIREL